MKCVFKTIIKRNIALCLAMVLAFPLSLTNISYAVADDVVIKYGDVDSDGADNAKDALLVLQHAAKISGVEGNSFIAGDVNGDEKLDAQDALLILQKAAKLIDEYPVEKKSEATEVPTEVPTEDVTVAPTATEELTPDATVTPEITIIPTTPPTPTPTPKPTPYVPDVQDDDVVAGIPVEIKNLNGAAYDEGEKLITFTDANTSKRTGVEIVNPISGNQDMIDDYGYLRDLEVEGLVNVFDLTYSKLGWGRDEEKLPIPQDQLDEKPDRTDDNRTWYRAATNEVYYPVPRNRQGFSMSFWAKTNKEQDNGAAIVFANATQTTSISISATAKYTDSQISDNFFSTDQNLLEPDYEIGQWHYYTVTFANDWICIYIDGVEIPYDEIELSRKKMRSFNNGFLTRKNAAVTWTEEDFENDWQGYLKNQHGTRSEYETITSDDYTVFGNGRYRGLGAVERLMLTFMAGETTKVYIGGASVEAGSGAAKYQFESGTRIAQVEYYLNELTSDNVRANYLNAKMPDDSNIVIATSTPEVSTNPDITPKPVDKLDGLKVELSNIHKSASYDEATGIYTFDKLVAEDGAYFGVQMLNPFELNENVTQTIEEALEGQELFPTQCTPDPEDPEAEAPKVVAGNSTAVQYWRGNYYSDYYYGDITKYGNLMTDAEKNPETATEKHAFHKPVWTKGASVGFWFNPTEALIESDDPIFTMGKVNEYFFTLSADGTVQYYDGQGISFKGGQIPFKDNMQCYNTFTARGDKSYVTAGEWNYYLVTFANDWIQVYVNGKEMIYELAGVHRAYTKNFNAGFLTRYNNIGMVTEDPYPEYNYVTKADGLTVLPSTIDETFNGNDETCVRTNGVYSKGYNKESEKTEYGSSYRLMLDSLTIEGGNFYMGGYATSLTKKYGWKSNAIAQVFHTEHNINDGSAFADVRFYEFEATKEEAAEIYEKRQDTKPAVIEPTATPEPTATAEPGPGSVSGSLVKNLEILDQTYGQYYSIDSALAVGDTIFGDRAFTFVDVNAALIGAEYIVTSCDAKKITTDMLAFTAEKDMILSVGFDARLKDIPAWASDLTKTELTCTASNDVIFVIYQKEVKAGERVVLGAQGTSSGVVGYIAMTSAK